MKRLCIGLVCCLQFLMLSGQSLPVGSGTIRWIDPQTAGFPVVQGQAWSQEMTGNYCRLPGKHALGSETHGLDFGLPFGRVVHLVSEQCRTDPCALCGDA